MTVTIKDVAQAAGVSVATVSRVLAGREGVGEARRQLVRQTCKDLRYRPDALAAALRTRSSSSVGILVPDLTNPYFPAVVQSVEHELAQVAIDLLLCDASNDVRVEARRLETLLRRRVDALLICPVDRDASAPALRSAARAVRLLQLDRHAIDEADFIGVDGVAGMTQVVEHIRSCGAESAMFLGDHHGISSIRERACAFEAACDANGIATQPTVRVLRPDVAAGREITRELLARRRLPSAIVCANDQIAFGVLVELSAAGVRCPHDVLVTGYDDAPAAELMSLTTVRQPLRELGREAARLLRHESEVARQVRLIPTLVPRATTTPNTPPTIRSTA